MAYFISVLLQKLFLYFFISVLLQKLVLYFKRPVACVGSVVELRLNLLSSNGGVVRLVLNILRGNVVHSDRSSSTFRSLLGFLDNRFELDKSIRYGDSRYNASLSIMAAKLSYENEAFVETVIRDHWQMEFLKFYNCWNEYQQQFSTKAIMFQDTSVDPNLVVVAFRGTNPFDVDAWCTDVDLSWYELNGNGRVHGGFMKALGLQKKTGWPNKIEEDPQKPFAYYTIRQKLRDALGNNKAKFIVTGHSLGGALAILFVGMLGFHDEVSLLERLEGVYTFGQPRVGDENFGEFMKKKLRVNDVRYYRYVYCNDVVPRLPFDNQTFLFRHFGPCLHYNSNYEGQKLEEEPNKNYFSRQWFVPKYLNAVWELTRSFIIPYKEGPKYKEGQLLKLFRVIGMTFPGLSAHLPGDYVNLTRLGTDPSSLRPIHNPQSTRQSEETLLFSYLTNDRSPAQKRKNVMAMSLDTVLHWIWTLEMRQQIASLKTTWMHSKEMKF